jgi:hypothetical protein
MCTACHRLENVVRSHRTAKEWGDVVDDMVSRGGQGKDADIDEAIAYLTKNFGPTTNSAAAKANGGK